METTICIIVTVLCGVLFLIPTVAVFKLFYTIISDISIKQAPFLGIVVVVLSAALCIVCASGSVEGTYIVANKFFGRPKPSVVIEQFRDGKKYYQYQVLDHFCNPDDKDSLSFVAIIPADRNVSRDDICINCHRTFANHNTHVEQGLFKAFENASTYP